MILLDKIKNRLKKIYFKSRYKKPFLFSSKFGFKMVIYPTSIIDENFYWGDFETDNLVFFRNLVKEEMVIFDIGANVGLYSLTAAAKMKDSIKIYAFEPAEIPLNRLNDNIELNNFKNISVHNVGVSDREGTVEFNICEDDAYNSIGSSPMQEISKKVEINVTSINSFCQANNIDRIDIIKIDTEGAELLILRGGGEIFESENAPILFCEYNRLTASGYDYTLRDYEEQLKAYNYKIFEIKEGNLIGFDPAVSDNSNILCLKDNHIQSLRKHIN